jgi:cobalt/nickel transport system permease protein
MHMADALLSPAVGATFWIASSALLAWSSRKIRIDARDDLIPLMGVLGAFVFAAQMVNFSIPGTGSSGHLGGGLLLSILLGPSAAFIVMASVLTVQALFFADGGLLALGANMFNMAVSSCFIVYPLLYRPLLKRAGASPSGARVGLITVLAAVVGLQLGSLGVVLQTQLSGISSLPLNAFLWLMQPIHLAIGLVEGVASAALIVFVRQARPDLLANQGPHAGAGARANVPVRWLIGLAVLAGLTAGVFSWFSSSQPDGLAWSVARVTGQPTLTASGSAWHTQLQAAQQKVAIFSGYQLPDTVKQAALAPAPVPVWPAVDSGTSLAGVVGGLATLLLVVLAGYLIQSRQRRLPVAET